MKASNSKDATPAQYLEHLRKRKGITHARRVRDELGWRWNASALGWTIAHHWLSWLIGLCTAVAGVVGFASDLKGLLL